MKPPKQVEVAMCTKVEKLVPGEWSSNEISVHIGKLDETDGKPRNFRHDYETPKTSTGGCFARIFASSSGCGANANLFGSYGPETNFGQIAEYEHGARALKLIAKRMQSIYEVRGNALDAADEMGRWLECCGVEQVYTRDAGVDNEWHHKGEWKVLTIGQFVRLVRVNLHVKHAEVEAVTTA